MDGYDSFWAHLTGTLMRLEFGEAGQIARMWASDPGLPEEGEDFQYVLPPIQFGEESSDDYAPGTILLGARTDPDEPWIVSRSRAIRPLPSGEDEDDSFFPSSSVEFDYDFPLLDGLQATGSYYEVSGAVPQIAWDVTLRNIGRRTLEIGEVGFPLALNNFYDGFNYTDEHLRKLWTSRLYIHKFIGGAASWLFAERMTAESPGLLVFPGEDTSWEFYSHVRGSLNTPDQWEGIPIVYAHSKATIEREEWRGWANEHTSVILEPGDSRTFRMRMVPTENDKADGVNQVLNMCGRPTIKVLPSAVAPVDVGIALEVSGTAPTQFYLSREAHIETDTDEHGGFCFIKPSEPGALVVSFYDLAGRLCHAHLMFTEPVGSLIHKRADWITENQTVEPNGGMLDGAIVLTNIATGEKVVDPAEYAESSGLEGSLADALYLAEKNALFPDEAQVAVIDGFVEQFLLDDVQNPGSGAVASIFTESRPGYFGRPMNYPHVANLYHAMARIARFAGGTTRSELTYLRLAAKTVRALFEHGWRLYVRSVGILGFGRFYDLVDDLRAAGLDDDAESVSSLIGFKAGELTKLDYPFAGETAMDTSGFEEVFLAAKHLDDDEHLERAVRCAFAARSMAPSWWWYGSDKRYWDGGDSTPLVALVDRGEACLSHTTIPNSLIFFGLMDRDYLGLPENYMRKAFGGMLGPWALVRSDGAASMCYCPDQASQQYGYNKFTGSSGLGYYHYLRCAGAYVLPNREQGIYAFGCHYGTDNDVHTVRPWDGIGRKIVLRQIGTSFELDFGVMTELRLDARLRWFEADIMNPSPRDVVVRLVVTGLWGDRFELSGTPVTAKDGRIVLELHLAAGSSGTFRVASVV